MNESTTQFWALGQDTVWHAVESPIVPMRSLCGIRVDVDKAFVVGDPSYAVDQDRRELGRRCRSCLEKLGGAK